jgi:hypothetical protein
MISRINLQAVDLALPCSPTQHKTGYGPVGLAQAMMNAATSFQSSGFFRFRKSFRSANDPAPTGIDKASIPEERRNFTGDFWITWYPLDVIATT